MPTCLESPVEVAVTARVLGLQHRGSSRRRVRCPRRSFAPERSARTHLAQGETLGQNSSAWRAALPGSEPDAALRMNSERAETAVNWGIAAVVFYLMGRAIARLVLR